MKQTLASIYYFYIDGFRNMTVGKILWTIILIKLFIMFFIIKPLFFSPSSTNKPQIEQEQSEYIYKELLNRGR